jgi:hypothetical protein
MEETVPIIHSCLVRRNRNSSKNPYGGKLSRLCDFDSRKRGDQSARTGASMTRHHSRVVTYPT